MLLSHALFQRGLLGPAMAVLMPVGIALLFLLLLKPGKRPRLSYAAAATVPGVVTGVLLLVLISTDPERGLLNWTLVAGVVTWLLGAALGAWGISHRPPDAEPSPAAGAELHGRLLATTDFSWGTFLACGLGLMLAELILAGGIALLSSGVQLNQEASRALRLTPTGAILVSGLVASLVAFIAGSLGAWWSRRLAAPEATLGVLYLGTAIPALLTAAEFSPAMAQAGGPGLFEVRHAASLLGPAALGFWLAFIVLVLFLVLGITVGFVLAGSGRLDTRLGYELFIARRHVEIFRLGFLGRIFAVLLLGIVPPLLLLAIVRASEAAVERTRIRRVGVVDPLKAAASLHAQRASEGTPTSMMTTLSVGGVAVGVMALIVVMSVMSGFEGDLRDKILGTNAHAVVHSYLGEIPSYEDIAEKARKVPGVVGATPFIIQEVMVVSDANVSGAVIKGIDPQTVDTVTDVGRNILPGGSLENLVDPSRLVRRRINPDGRGAVDRRAGKRPPSPSPAPEDPVEAPVDDAPIIDDEFIQLQVPVPHIPPVPDVLPGILLGRELATQLRVVVGDRVNVVSPLSGELGPQGPMPKDRSFRVAGIFHSGMYEYDSKFVYITLQEAQSFFNVRGALGIELKVDDVDDARNISRRVVTALEGYPYRARDWGEMNQNLFSALRLEKLVMGVILSIISIVAAGLIIATVIMLVLEKRKEIAVLKALGVPDGGILKIFMAEGLQIGVAGGLIGLVSGLLWCLFIEKIGIQLDPDIYYIPALPVRLEAGQTVLAVVVAVLVSFFASLYPALQASRFDPVEGLKAE
ncbi:MAG TPA: ABC transporter permease [Myxococcaceae bacterium]|nr:ABC transporter permease [Myxococcaceae bacterium]